MDTALYIVAGLVLLALGGEGVVRGAVSLARRFGMSELLIGLTLVGFGTSAPELLTSINAANAGAPGIAIGNVVGSNISNVLLIFAVVALVRPVIVDRNAIARDSGVMLAASAALVCVAVLAGEISRLVGACFLLGLIGYIVIAFQAERKGGAAAALHVAEAGEAVAETHDPLALSLAFAVGGMAALAFGADLLVTGAVTLAKAAGMSETVIGLTIVAIGTSLPELVASLAAALRGRSDVAVGNIIGSNIYNVLGIVGVTAMVTPIAVPADMIARDWIAMLGGSALMVAIALAYGRVGRIAGAVFLAGYAVYTLLLLQGAAVTPS